MSQKNIENINKYKTIILSILIKIIVLILYKRNKFQLQIFCEIYI